MPRLSRISDYYESSDAGSPPSSPTYTYTRLSPTAASDYSEADLASDWGSVVDLPESSECGSDSLGDVLATDEQDYDEPIANTSTASEASCSRSSSEDLPSEPPSTVAVPGPDGIASANSNLPATRQGRGLHTPPPHSDSQKDIEDSVGSTPVIAKPSTQHYHSVDPQAGSAHTPTLRRQYAVEMELRTAQISVEAFMQAFLPEKNVPTDLNVEAFDPECFETRESRMYPELVSRGKQAWITRLIVEHLYSAKWRPPCSLRQPSGKAPGSSWPRTQVYGLTPRTRTTTRRKRSLM